MMRAGSWPSIALIYLYGVVGSATLSKVIPLQGDFQSQLGASATEFGLLLALLSIPPALLATLGGTLADRIGARTTLVVASALGVVANLAELWAPSLDAFFALRLLEGCVLVGVYTAAPALIMATTSDARRGKAMAAWSTYTPVGISTGLLLSSQFAGTDDWRMTYAVMACLHGALVLVGFLLPRTAPPAAAAPGATRPSLWAAYTDPGPLRVALTFGMVVIMGFGVATVFPGWYAAAQGVTTAEASRLLSGINLFMIAGGGITAVLLGRGWSGLSVMLVMAVLSVLSALGVFWPGTAASLVLGSLVLWMLTNGSAIAVVTSTLPQVIRNPAQGAAAAGLLSQTAALCTFMTPQIWLPLQSAGLWLGCIAVVVLAWIAALLLLPSRPR
jgi:MFS family permease